MWTVIFHLWWDFAPRLKRICTHRLALLITLVDGNSGIALGDDFCGECSIGVANCKETRLPGLTQGQCLATPPIWSSGFSNDLEISFKQPDPRVLSKSPTTSLHSFNIQTHLKIL